MRRACLILLLPAFVLAREVRLLRLEVPDGVPARLFLVGETVESELDLPLLSTSTRRATVGPEACVLHLAKEKPTPRQPLPADAPAVQIPAGDADLLLVLLGGPGSLGIRAVPVTLPDARGQAGALLWFNLQARTLLVGLGGGAPVAIAPGTSRVTLPPVAVDATFPVRLDLAPTEPDQEAQPFVRTTWVRAKHGRHLFFVLVDPDRVVPRIVSVPDLDEPPPPVVTPNGPSRNGNGRRGGESGESKR